MLTVNCIASIFESVLQVTGRWFSNTWLETSKMYLLQQVFVHGANDGIVLSLKYKINQMQYKYRVAQSSYWIVLENLGMQINIIKIWGNGKFSGFHHNLVHANMKYHTRIEAWNVIQSEKLWKRYKRKSLWNRYNMQTYLAWNYLYPIPKGWYWLLTTFVVFGYKR